MGGQDRRRGVAPGHLIHPKEPREPGDIRSPAPVPARCCARHLMCDLSCVTPMPRQWRVENLRMIQDVIIRDTRCPSIPRPADGVQSPGGWRVSRGESHLPTKQKRRSRAPLDPTAPRRLNHCSMRRGNNTGVHHMSLLQIAQHRLALLKLLSSDHPCSVHLCSLDGTHMLF